MRPGGAHCTSPCPVGTAEICATSVERGSHMCLVTCVLPFPNMWRAFGVETVALACRLKGRGGQAAGLAAEAQEEAGSRPGTPTLPRTSGAVASTRQAEPLGQSSSGAGKQSRLSSAAPSSQRVSPRHPWLAVCNERSLWGVLYSYDCAKTGQTES